MKDYVTVVLLVVWLHIAWRYSTRRVEGNRPRKPRPGSGPGPGPGPGPGLGPAGPVPTDVVAAAGPPVARPAGAGPPAGAAGSRAAGPGPPAGAAGSRAAGAGPPAGAAGSRAAGAGPPAADARAGDTGQLSRSLNEEGQSQNTVEDVRTQAEQAVDANPESARIINDAGVNGEANSLTAKAASNTKGIFDTVAANGPGFLVGATAMVIVGLIIEMYRVRRDNDPNTTLSEVLEDSNAVAQITQDAEEYQRLEQMYFGDQQETLFESLDAVMAGIFGNGWKEIVGLTCVCCSYCIVLLVAASFVLPMMKK